MLNGLTLEIPLFWQIIVFIFSLVLGAVCLVKFCSVFLDSSSVIAQRFNISPLVIGLTIVAIGTSLPEFAVSVVDSISSLRDGGNASVGFSNVVGSNISNLLLILSCAGIFSPLIIKKKNIKDYLVLIGITSLLSLFVLLFGNKVILRWESIILVVLIIFYLIYIVKSSVKSRDVLVEKVEGNLLKAILLIIVSIVAIALGGELVVYGAKGIALNVSHSLSVNEDMAESLVGLTIVAVGTSLPELVATVIASKRGENEMALGNVIGSNIFNIIFVLGVSGIIAPFSVASYMLIDLGVMIAATFVVFGFVCKGKISKKNSFVLLGMYFIYLIYLIMRTILGL